MKHWNLRNQKSEETRSQELVADICSYEFLTYKDSNGESGIVLRLEYERPDSKVLGHIDLELDLEEAQVFLDCLVEAMTEV